MDKPNLSDAQRHIENAIHIFRQLLDEPNTPNTEQVKQALYRAQESVTHTVEAQGGKK